MVLAEELKGVAVSGGLVLTGKVQVDIRHLLAAVAQEGLEGDVEPVLDILGPADGTDRIRHIRAAAVPLPCREIAVLAVGAAVMGRQGVDLGDPRQEGHDRGPHGAPGAHQVAVLQGVLHQLLGGHRDDVVLPLDDAGEL